MARELDPVEEIIAAVDRLKGQLASRSMQKVEHLDLSVEGLGNISHYIEDERFWDRFPGGGPETELLQALVSSGNTRHLTSLRMTFMTLTSAIEILVKSSLFRRLKILDLAHSSLGDDGMKILAKASGLCNVQVLCAGDTGTGNQGVKALVTFGNTVNLRYLDLCRNPLGKEAGRMIASSPYLSNLETLNIGSADWPPGDIVLTSLARSKGLDKLAELHLDYSGIRTAGIEALCKAGGLPQLALLGLEGNRIGDKGARVLLHAPFSSQLTRLDLRWNGIGKVCQKALRKRLGEIVVL
jgi:Ran GTPase-activating protein (RanGAP) involved in mRNA processing and transport